MKKALRMSRDSYTDERNFERNLKLLSENKDVIDEVTLFTDQSHHGYRTIESVEKTANILKDRIRCYKEIGIKRVGINVLCTLGHTEDASGFAPKADLQYVTNFDGRVSGSCLCPSDERFFPYVAKKYSIYATTGADFIWLDDDIRINNHGVVRDYCFCPECVKKFNLKYGTEYSIDEIRRMFKEDPSFQKKWHESAADTLTRVFDTIRRAIKETDSSVDIGYMSERRTSIAEWMDASGAVLARPGGGFYNDVTPISVFDKYFNIQLNIAGYPERIKDIQYEYEEYNFLTMQKSKHIAELETSLMIMAGCNGILYNRWGHTQSFLDMMRASAKKWDRLAELNEGCKTMGVFCPQSNPAKCLNEIAIPTTPHIENACACYILGYQWSYYTNSEIEKMLQIGVYTDGSGLINLRARGFGDLGGNVGKCYSGGVWEHFTDHPLNGNEESTERYVSLDIFREGDAFELLPDADSETVSIFNSEFYGLLGCSAYVYRRKDGSVIAIDGCLMPSQIQTNTKKAQMTNVFDMISGQRMPVVIDKCIKAIPVVTSNGERVNIMITNAHFDPTGSFEIRVRAGKDFKLLSDDGELLPIKQRTVGNETVVSVDNIGGWQYILLTGSVE